jgi:hypothetical protein
LFTGHYLGLSAEAKVELVAALSEPERANFVAWSAKCESVHNANKHKLNGVVNLKF